MKIIFLVMISSLCFAAPIESAAQQVEIPPGVRYKTKPDSLNETARKLVLAELSAAKTYSLYGNAMYVGPQLWLRYQKIKSLVEIPGGNIQINIGQEKKAAGKLIQTTSDFKLFWDQVAADLSGDTVQIRKLTAKELQYYWAVIFYDIEEPVFILETTNRKILLQLTPDLHAFWVDEIL